MECRTDRCAEDQRREASALWCGYMTQNARGLQLRQPGAVGCVRGTCPEIKNYKNMITRRGRDSLSPIHSCLKRSWIRWWYSDKRNLLKKGATDFNDATGLELTEPVRILGGQHAGCQRL